MTTERRDFASFLAVLAGSIGAGMGSGLETLLSQQLVSGPRHGGVLGLLGSLLGSHPLHWRVGRLDMDMWLMVFAMAGFLALSMPTWLLVTRHHRSDDAS